jgi:hypothetical protein
MLSIGPLFILSASLFTFFAWLFAVEARRGQRIFLSSFRQRLDTIIDGVTVYLARKLTYIGRHTIKLSWYYSIHKVLRLILSGLVKFYDYLESIFMRNRARARTLKLEKRGLGTPEGHFTQVAEHKASSALTETQKKKLLQKKLERG